MTLFNSITNNIKRNGRLEQIINENETPITMIEKKWAHVRHTLTVVGTR